MKQTGMFIQGPFTGMYEKWKQQQKKREESRASAMKTFFKNLIYTKLVRN